LGKIADRSAGRLEKEQAAASRYKRVGNELAKKSEGSALPDDQLVGLKEDYVFTRDVKSLDGRKLTSRQSKLRTSLVSQTEILQSTGLEPAPGQAGYTIPIGIQRT